MSGDSKSSEVSTKQRQALITALPCFAMLSEKDSQELAGLMTELRYSPGEKIVEEDVLVDSIYIIVQGCAEVTHLVPLKKRKIKIKLSKKPPKMIIEPLAMLHPGETIGLSDIGFFSSTGKRTATVTAQTNMVLLYLDLKSLHDFLERHQLQSAMYASAEQMLRTRFIKQSLPFSRLSQERLMWLANQIEERHVALGEIIFQEGQVGDRCYLIRSGEVDIVTKNEDGTEHQLATLKAPTLFGEATLISHEPRNATARAATMCELFELKHEYLSELLESENNVAKTFMTLMVDRSRPAQNPNVTAHHRTTVDEQVIIILKNPDNGSYFKLSGEGWFIWQQMNGQHTMQEITMSLANEFDVFAPDVVAALISKLAKTGFVTQVDIEDVTMLAKQPAWVKSMLLVRRILESRIAIGDADKWLTALYNKAAFILFSSIGKILLIFIIIMGFFAFGFSTQHEILLFRTIHDSWILIIYLVPFTLLSVALHEMGHALATKSYGREVHYMGIGWYWLGPIAFTDTSDMWLSRKRAQRIFVNLAGVCTDILVAGICSLLIFVIPSVHVQAFLWLFALFTYLSAFRMLNPLQELDGYYVLVDLFDRPRLRQFSVMWLVRNCSKKTRDPNMFKKHIPEVCYWMACILFLILISLLTLLVQTFVFKILGFKPSNPLISLSLPIFVGFISCLGIIADIRNQAEE